MARNFATVEINVSGNLLPIVRAFNLMNDALRIYGHRWSTEDEATINEASERIFESAQLEAVPDLDGRGN